MEAIILMGVQASGKSTFYHRNYANTHIRVNLDMLRTRRREEQLIRFCLDTGMPFVVDNTNVTREERTRYFDRLNGTGYSVAGYYFQSEVQACKARNAARNKDQRVPITGLLGTHGRLELPSMAEGFDALYYVRLVEQGGFSIEAWQDEV